MKVGLTGGIGAGKTSCAKLFEFLGIPIYNADQRAKYLMVNHDELRLSISRNFGTKSYTAHGQLNRAYLAQLIFNDEKKLSLMNSLVHPIVHQDFNNWCFEKLKNSLYVIQENAIMVESSSHHLMDKLIVVSAPQVVRLKRVIKRDGSTEQQVMSRMHKQADQDLLLSKADYVIHNDGHRSIVNSVYNIHCQLLRLIPPDGISSTL